MAQLYEKYRPRRLQQVIGQPKVVGQIRALMQRRTWDRDALWIEGPSGTGKTTIAEAVAREVGALTSSKECWSYIEMDGDKCVVDEVRAMDAEAHAAGLFADQWRVFVINEAHAMAPKAVQAWLTLLERLPRRWLVIFTTTQSRGGLFGDFGGPFASRCKCFRLTNQALAPTFARFACRIAGREGYNGRPQADYLRLVKECRNNMREVLQRIEQGELAE